MMFLEFFIWGGWFVTLGTFLGNNLSATGAETGMAYSTQSWGAIVAPFIIGLIADRFFNAEKILAVLHLIGAVLMYQMSQATEFNTFYPYVLGYMIAYMPTLGTGKFNRIQSAFRSCQAISFYTRLGYSRMDSSRLVNKSFV